jgi:hypothetical protein
LDTWRPHRGHLLVALLWLLLAGAAQSGPLQAVHTSLAVTAVVPRHASVRIAPPASITISEADIRAGYLELAAPVDVAVQSNVQQGYILLFELDGTQMRGVRVSGAQQALLVGRIGVIVARPATGTGLWRDRLQLRLRFDLAEGATAGEHAWPLRIVMMSQ